MPSGRPSGPPGAPPGAASAVEQRLRRRLATAGRLPFAVVMEEALYGDGGYYRRVPAPIGRQGDFITGSSYSPLFGRATATLLRRLDAVLDAPAEMFEAGCGEGSHLAAVVAALAGSVPSPGGRPGVESPGRQDQRDGAPPGARAATPAPAPGRRLRGWDRVERPLPAGVGRVERLEEVARREIHGLLFSYELFDALPVHRLVGLADGGIGELWVESRRDGSLALAPGELSDPALPELLAGAALAEGQVADLAPGWRPLYRRLAERLGRGLLVTCDYGFERRRLLDRRVRFHGTLACYRRHAVHRDALRDLGRQDLTAHVDFTALRETGEAAGLDTVALTRQARWLAACGLFEDLAGADPATRVEARTLLDGEGMGEEIRVLVQARGVDAGRVLDPRLLGAA